MDSILNEILKTCNKKLDKILIILFQAYIIFFYYFFVFKKTNTIALKKPWKADYIISKTYKSKALFNILNKVLEAIMIKKIIYLPKKYHFLLERDIYI